MTSAFTQLLSPEMIRMSERAFQFTIDRLISSQHGQTSSSAISANADQLNASKLSSSDQSTEKKYKRTRTTFTTRQLSALEKRFQRDHYLSATDRAQLAEELELSSQQVKNWFQNRRMRDKRETKSKVLKLASPSTSTDLSLSTRRGIDVPALGSITLMDSVPTPTPTPTPTSDSQLSFLSTPLPQRPYTLPNNVFFPTWAPPFYYGKVF